MDFFYRSLRSWMERLSEDFVDGDGRQRRVELIVVVVSALSLCGRTGRSWACCSTSCGSDWWQFVFWDCDGARAVHGFGGAADICRMALRIGLDLEF